jgi:hypothetical protein
MKQETIEEAAEKQWGNVHRTGVLGFIDGVEYQKERSYDREEVESLIRKAVADLQFVYEDWEEEDAEGEEDEFKTWIEKNLKK